MYHIFCKVWPECTIVCVMQLKPCSYHDKGSLFMLVFTKCSELHLRSWWIIFVLQVKVIVMSHKCSCILLYQYFVLQVTKSTSEFYPWYTAHGLPVMLMTCYAITIHLPSVAVFSCWAIQSRWVIIGLWNAFCQHLWVPFHETSRNCPVRLADKSWLKVLLREKNIVRCLKKYGF